MQQVNKPKKPMMFYYMVVLVILFLLNFLLFPQLLKPDVKEVDYDAVVNPDIVLRDLVKIFHPELVRATGSCRRGGRGRNRRNPCVVGRGWHREKR